MAFPCNKVVIFVMCTVLLVGTCMIETAQARKAAISRHHGDSTTEPRLLSEKEAESNSLRKNGDDDHNMNKAENNKPSTPWGENDADDSKVQIGNGVMTRDLPYCGPNHKNCKHHASNPYNRGCLQGERCRGNPRANAGLKSMESNNNDHDHDDDDHDKPEEENKTPISNGAMGRNNRYCGPNNKNCKNKEQGNPYNRGCNAGQRCRGRPNDDEKTESKTGGHEDDDDKPDEENKTTISNGAMRRNTRYCGPNNKNCKNKEQGNPYSRGCNAGQRCRGRPNDDEKTESKTGGDDKEEDDDDDEKRSKKSGPEDENKVTIGNGVMQRNSPYCGPLSNGSCHQMQPGNQYNRGCNAGEKCRGN